MTNRRVAWPVRVYLPAILCLAACGCDGWFSSQDAQLPAALKTPIAFEDVTARLGDAGRVMGWGGLAAFDYDNDGDIDLYITNGPGAANRLLANNGRANFTDVPDAAGLSATDDNGACAGVGDLNNDGWLDVIIGRQLIGVPAGSNAGCVLFLNNGPGAGGAVTFRRLTAAETGLTSTAPAAAIGVADLDNDGLLDLVIGRYDMSVNGNLLVPSYPSQPNELWRCTGIQSGVPQYVQVTGAGIEGTPRPARDPNAAVQEFIPGTLVLYMTDVDQDGLIDFFDLHDIPGGIDYFHNDGGLVFSRRQADILDLNGGWMGMCGGDYDNDGDLDYFITNTGSDLPLVVPPSAIAAAHNDPNGSFFHMLLRNDAGKLANVTAATLVAPSTVLPPTNQRNGQGLEAYEFGFGAAWIDTDNLGILDLYWAGDLVAEGPFGVRGDSHGVGRFLRNNADGGFSDLTAERGLFNIPFDKPVAFGSNDAARAVVAVDLDGDGFRDLVLTNATMLGTPDARVRVFLNPAAGSGQWLTVRLLGTASNRAGIGARVKAVVGGTTYICEVLSTTSAFAGVQPEAHFGFGKATVVDTLEVHWPSGAVSMLTNVATNQVLTVTE